MSKMLIGLVYLNQARASMRLKIIIAAVVLIAVLLPFAFHFDRQLYFYGQNDFDHKSSLPFGVKPIFRYDFEGGLYIADSSDMSIVFKGQNKWTTGDSVNVKDITRYGYSNNNFIVEVQDSQNNNRYIQVYPCKSSPNAACVKMLSKIDVGTIKGLTWIDLNTKYSDPIHNQRGQIMFFIILIVGLTVALVIVKTVLISRRRSSFSNKNYLNDRKLGNRETV